jgi:AcrR family transcriptional regulator
MRDALIAAAARQFVARGVNAVSVEDLIAEADLSRSTFYELFDNKYSLLEHIVNPVFDEAAARLAALAVADPAVGLQGVIDTYLALWRDHRDGLLLIPVIDAQTFQRFEARHKALNDALLVVLLRAEQAGLLRNGSAHYSLKVIARTAIPLLRVYDGHPGAQALFRDALRSLLVRDGVAS